MDKAVLVNNDIAAGSEILRALDESGIKVSVAGLLILPEYEDWRLVLAAPAFDRAGLLEAYGLIHQALKAVGFPIERKPPIVILPMKDESIKDLRRVFGKAKSVEGMRVGGQMIGQRFIEDGYLYRIS